MGNKAMAGRLAPFGILAIVELRLPPLISHETGDPSEGWGVRAKRGQTGDPSEGWGLSRAKRVKKRRRPPGSRVRKTLLPLFIELSGLNLRARLEFLCTSQRRFMQRA